MGMTTNEVRQDHANLRRLATLGLPGPYVTLAVPPVRGTAGLRSIDETADSLIRDARRSLIDEPWKLTAQAAERLLRQATEQLLDAPRDESEGVVIVVADDYVEALAVRGPVEADHVVAGRPDLALLAEVSAASRPFHLLALSQHRVELYRCTDGSVTPVTDVDLPSSLADTVWLDRQPIDAVLHGGPSPKDEHKADVARFVAAVDRALPSAVHDGPLPLVVVAVAYEAAMLREARPHRDLVLVTELGSPDRLAVEAMRDAAVRRLELRTAGDLAALVDRYRSRAGTGRTAAGLEPLATEAAEGRVDVLLVDAEHRRTALPDARRRLAVVVADVLARGGSVRLLPDDLPSTIIDDLAVAILRY